MDKKVEMLITAETCLSNCRILDGWTSKLDNGFIEHFKVDIDMVGRFSVDEGEEE